MVSLLTSQVSAGDPAYIAARAVNMGSDYACESTVETSTDGGQTWMSGTSVTLPADPPVSPPEIPSIFATTSAVYDGPGYLGRACAKAPDSTLACTAAISLGPGAGTPPDPALPAGTNVRDALAGVVAGKMLVECHAYLISTTSAKGPGTLAGGWYMADSLHTTTSSRCEGWLETSADHGATWQASPPVTFQSPAESVTYDFIGTTPDGPGLLARACVKAPTVSATPYCSSTW
jgi:hypothetical protein